MTDSTIPDPALAAMQERCDAIIAELKALELERDAAIKSFAAKRDELRDALKRIERAAKAYRGDAK